MDYVAIGIAVVLFIASAYIFGESAGKKSASRKYIKILEAEAEKLEKIKPVT